MVKVDQAIADDALRKINRTIVRLVECVKKGEDVGENAYIIKNAHTGIYYVTIEEKKPHNALFDCVSKEYIENRFYKITCSNVDFVNKLDLNKGMLLSGPAKHQNDISMTQTERNFLYNFVKKIAPKKIMEFSPFHGFSTITICSASKDIGYQPDFFETHELEKENVQITNFNLYENDIDYVKVMEGDVFLTLDREKLKEVDFLFVDSDHSGDFAKRYIDEFFPLLKDGCWVAIHDISCSWYFASPEKIEVMKYFEKNNIDTYFHIGDLLKMYQIVDDEDYIWSNARNTLLFYRVKK